MRAPKLPSSNRTRTTTLFAAALSIVLGMLAVSAGPAAASPDATGPGAASAVAAARAISEPSDPTPLGTCTVIGPVRWCGKIKNSVISQKYIVTTDNWPPANGNWSWVYPGQRSPFTDTDGFFVPPNCTALDDWDRSFAAGAWHKINDLYDGEVRLNCWA
jgi:hypothetical protein